MRGLCDAARCAVRARWYAVARGKAADGTVRRVGLNVSACDEHAKQKPAELMRDAGMASLLNNLLARLPDALEVEWEHIGGT